MMPKKRKKDDWYSHHFGSSLMHTPWVCTYPLSSKGKWINPGMKELTDWSRTKTAEFTLTHTHHAYKGSMRMWGNCFYHQSVTGVLRFSCRSCGSVICCYYCCHCSFCISRIVFSLAFSPVSPQCFYILREGIYHASIVLLCFVESVFVLEF